MGGSRIKRSSPSDGAEPVSKRARENDQIDLNTNQNNSQQVFPNVCRTSAASSLSVSPQYLVQSPSAPSAPLQLFQPSSSVPQRPLPTNQSFPQQQTQTIPFPPAALQRQVYPRQTLTLPPNQTYAFPTPNQVPVQYVPHQGQRSSILSLPLMRPHGPREIIHHHQLPIYQRMPLFHQRPALQEEMYQMQYKQQMRTTICVSPPAYISSPQVQLPPAPVQQPLVGPNQPIMLQKAPPPKNPGADQLTLVSPTLQNQQSLQNHPGLQNQPSLQVLPARSCATGQPSLVSAIPSQPVMPPPNSRTGQPPSASPSPLVTQAIPHLLQQMRKPGVTEPPLLLKMLSDSSSDPNPISVSISQEAMLQSQPGQQVRQGDGQHLLVSPTEPIQPDSRVPPGINTGSSQIQQVSATPSQPIMLPHSNVRIYQQHLVNPNQVVMQQGPRNMANNTSASDLPKSTVTEPPLLLKVVSDQCTSPNLVTASTDSEITQPTEEIESDEDGELRIVESEQSLPSSPLSAQPSPSPKALLSPPKANSPKFHKPSNLNLSSQLDDGYCSATASSLGSADDVKKALPFANFDDFIPLHSCYQEDKESEENNGPEEGRCKYNIITTNWVLNDMIRIVV